MSTFDSTTNQFQTSTSLVSVSISFGHWMDATLSPSLVYLNPFPSSQLDQWFKDSGENRNASKDNWASCKEPPVPCSLLLTRNNSHPDRQEVLCDYVNHHRTWMKSRLQHPGQVLAESETKWLSCFDSIQ